MTANSFLNEETKQSEKWNEQFDKLFTTLNFDNSYFRVLFK
jgi:hypothetical protein